VSRKDDRIASLEADLRETSARLDELLEEVDGFQEDTLALEAKLDVAVALVLRGAREVREPILRAGLLEDLEAAIPGSTDELRTDERPEVLRQRAAMRRDGSGS